MMAFFIVLFKIILKRGKFAVIVYESSFEGVFQCYGLVIIWSCL